MNIQYGLTARLAAERAKMAVLDGRYGHIEVTQEDGDTYTLRTTERFTLPVPMGEYLPNGAKVLDGHLTEARGATKRGAVVAAALDPDASVHPFATWWVDEAGNAFYGHYFGTEAGARADLAKRAKRGY